MKRTGRPGTLPLGGLYRNTRGVFYWRYSDADGKRISRSTGETDPERAREIAYTWAIEEEAIQRHLIRPAKAESSSITLQEAALQYFQHGRTHWVKGYGSNVAYYFDDLIMPFFGPTTPIHEITSARIGEFKAHLLKRMKPISANKVLSSLRQMLTLAVQSGLLENLPLIKNIPRHQEEHGRVLTRWEGLRLIAAARRLGEDALRFVCFGLLCGLRKSEALSVEWQDIDWEKELIRVQQKNRTTMPAPLGRMRDVLEATARRDRRGRVVCYMDIHTMKRRPVLRMEKTWNRIKRDARIKGQLRYHDLRHTFVDWCYKHLSPAIAPVMARHSSRDATAIYVHLERVETMKEAQKMYR